jgi:hypothetical protein
MFMITSQQYYHYYSTPVQTPSLLPSHPTSVMVHVLATPDSILLYATLLTIITITGATLVHSTIYVIVDGAREDDTTYRLDEGGLHWSGAPY